MNLKKIKFDIGKTNLLGFIIKSGKKTMLTNEELSKNQNICKRQVARYLKVLKQENKIQINCSRYKLQGWIIKRTITVTDEKTWIGCY